MIEFFILLFAVLSGIILYVYFSLDKRKNIVFQIITTVLSVLIYTGLYFAAKEWLSFKFDFWSNIGILYGLTALFWIAIKEVEKKQLKLIELSFLFLLPVLFYAVYGMDLALNIMLGISSVVLGYVFSNILRNMNLDIKIKNKESK
jgi:hypothetical protein